MSIPSRKLSLIPLLACMVAIPFAQAQVGTTELHFEVQDADTLGQVMVSASGTTPPDQPGAGHGTGGPFTSAYLNRIGEKKYVIRDYMDTSVPQVGTLSTPATYEVKYY